jgi:hypothetical protein
VHRDLVPLPCDRRRTVAGFPTDNSPRQPSAMGRTEERESARALRECLRIKPPDPAILPRFADTPVERIRQYRQCFPTHFGWL